MKKWAWRRKHDLPGNLRHNRVTFTPYLQEMGIHDNKILSVMSGRMPDYVQVADIDPREAIRSGMWARLITDSQSAKPIIINSGADGCLIFIMEAIDQKGNPSQEGVCIDHTPGDYVSTINAMHRDLGAEHVKLHVFGDNMHPEDDFWEEKMGDLLEWINVQPTITLGYFQVGPTPHPSAIGIDARTREFIQCSPLEVEPNDNDDGLYSLIKIEKIRPSRTPTSSLVFDGRL